MKHTVSEVECTTQATTAEKKGSVSIGSLHSVPVLQSECVSEKNQNQKNHGGLVNFHGISSSSVCLCVCMCVYYYMNVCADVCVGVGCGVGHVCVCV